MEQTSRGSLVPYFMKVDPIDPNPQPCITHYSSFNFLFPLTHMGGCQNHGPFLDPYYNAAPDI